MGGSLSLSPCLASSSTYYMMKWEFSLTFPEETSLSPVYLNGEYLLTQGFDFLVHFGHKKLNIFQRRISLLHSNPSGIYAICDEFSLQYYVMQFQQRHVEETTNSTHAFMLHFIFLPLSKGSARDEASIYTVRVKHYEDLKYSPLPIFFEEKRMENQGKSEEMNIPTIANVGGLNNVAHEKCKKEEEAKTKSEKPTGNDKISENSRVDENACRFYISDSWHIQADEMSESLMLQRPSEFKRKEDELNERKKRKANNRKKSNYQNKLIEERMYGKIDITKPNTTPPSVATEPLMESYILISKMDNKLSRITEEDEKGIN